MGAGVVLHQALHGYSSGHSLLAASRKLAPTDVRVMLALSDTAVPGLRVPEQGYLTGYPLTASGVFVLARTWPAPELTRPGCVWSHSVLIDFDDLAVLDSMSVLDAVFSRPTEGRYEYYAAPLNISPRSGTPPSSPPDATTLAGLLHGLYSTPEARLVVPSTEDVDSEAVCYALWSQQWPRLRRSFRFCTLAAADRSTATAKFDLQFYPPGSRGVRARFEGCSHPPPDPSEDAWLKHALADLRKGDGALHLFLRRVGGDIRADRAAFSTLSRIHLLLEETGDDADRAEEAVNALRATLPADEGRIARAVVVANAARLAANLSESTLAYVVEHWRLLDEPTRSVAAVPVGQAIWRYSVAEFAVLLHQPDVRSEIARKALAVAGVERAVSLVKEIGAGVLRDVLSLVPGVVLDPSFWRLETSTDDSAFQLVLDLDNPKQAIYAMIMSGRVLLSPASRALGPEKLAGFLVKAVEEAPQDPEFRELARNWLVATAKDADLLPKVLAVPPRKHWVLAAIARATNPDVLAPTPEGEDAWLWAAREASDSPGADAEYFAAFVLARALGRGSATPASLLAHCFDPVYRSTSAGTLGEEAWRLLSPRLPYSLYWAPWDRCIRVRQAVVDLFVDRDPSPSAFAGLTTDDGTFAQLASLAARRRRGRRLLRDVLEILKNAPEGREHRVAVLKELLI